MGKAVPGKWSLSSSVSLGHGRETTVHADWTEESIWPACQMPGTKTHSYRIPP
jgi:hypothetical protein